MRAVALMTLLALSTSPVGDGAPQETPATVAAGQEADAVEAAPAEPAEAPDEFVPSEQVRVDNEVSFPVDI